MGDLEEQMVMGGGGGGAWTDERHSSFLNWMEACFVKKLLSTDLGARRCLAHQTSAPPLPLNRYLPDSAESTLDSRKHKRRLRPFCSDLTDLRGRGNIIKVRKLLVVDPSLDDQVVPLFGSTDADEDDKETRRGELHVSVSPAAN